MDFHREREVLATVRRLWEIHRNSRRPQPYRDTEPAEIWILYEKVTVCLSAELLPDYLARILLTLGIHEMISPDSVGLSAYPPCGHEKIHQRISRNRSEKLLAGPLRWRPVCLAYKHYLAGSKMDLSILNL